MKYETRLKLDCLLTKIRDTDDPELAETLIKEYDRIMEREKNGEVKQKSERGVN